MSKEPVNKVFAANLKHFMQASDYKTQQALGAKCGIAQRTISNYLNPELRRVGSKGKAPSANLSQLQKIADALGIEVWQLLRPMSAAQRVIYRKVEEAFVELLSMESDAQPSSALQLHDARKQYRA